MMRFCPYTNTSPPECQQLWERVKYLERKLKEREKEAEVAMKNVAEVVAIVPRLKDIIDYPMTLLNPHSVILTVTELELTKEEEEKLKQAGFVVTIGCVSACGYGDIVREEKGNKVVYSIRECPCHPGHYYIKISSN